MKGKELRIGKLFNKSDNAVIVAIDHGMFDGPIPTRLGFRQSYAMWLKTNFRPGKQCKSTGFRTTVKNRIEDKQAV